MLKISRIVAIVIFFSSCQFVINKENTLKTSPPNTKSHLPDGIYELNSIDSSPNDDDLKPLGKLVGDAVIASFGESDHTVGSYITARFRILKYLVEKKGFRVVAFEFPRFRAKMVEEYTLKGLTTLDDAAKNMTVWSSEEIKPVLQWIKEYNQKHKYDQIRFFGFDTQEAIVDQIFINRYFKSILGENPITQKVEFSLKMCNTTGMGPFSRDMLEQCEKGIAYVQSYMQQNKDSLIHKSSEDEFFSIRVSLVGLQTWQRQIFHRVIKNKTREDSKLSFETRDNGMFRVFTMLKERYFANRKTMIWAHNGHLARNWPEAKNVYGEGAKSLGTFLKDHFNKDYVAIALTGYNVQLDWPQNNSCGRVPLTPDSIESELFKLNKNVLFVDLTSQNTTNSIFKKEVYYKSYYGVEMIPSDQFQGILYLKNAEKMQPLDRKPCVENPQRKRQSH